MRLKIKSAENDKKASVSFCAGVPIFVRCAKILSNFPQHLSFNGECGIVWLQNVKNEEDAL
jgi:hypothetical protein